MPLRVDDGRNYLLTTRKKYDVITADIILPRHAGAGALYSQEYFQLVRNALKDDGLVLQWNGAERRFDLSLDPADVPVGVSGHDAVGRWQV